MATKAGASKDSSGIPRWTYVTGTILGICTLLWAVASHFIPKSESTKHEGSPGSQGAASVSVSGSGSVGVGNMSGGAITLGAPAKAEYPSSSASATK